MRANGTRPALTGGAVDSAAGPTFYDGLSGFGSGRAEPEPSESERATASGISTLDDHGLTANNDYQNRSTHLRGSVSQPANSQQNQNAENVIREANPTITQTYTGQARSPGQTAHDRRIRHRQGRRARHPAVKASIKIASLNIRGQGNSNLNNPANKWNHINQLMRQKKIAILCVQEAHLTQERAAEIEASFERRILHIAASPDRENPTGKGGVAIVLSKDHIAAKDAEIKIKEIVPGRALLLRTKWRRDNYITILNIYAPNVTTSDASENKQFWECIEDYYLRHPRTPKPDFMLGDFNMVDDAIDRLPTRADHRDAVEALDNVKLLLDLQDGWRTIHPNEMSYTFTSHQDSHSRIDRIYATQRMLETAREWEIKPATGIPNVDHRMVTVQAVNENDPLVGTGRWTFPKHLMRERTLAKQFKEKGRTALEEISKLTAESRSSTDNAQIIFMNLKKEIRDLARARAKVVVPLTQQKLKNIEKQLRDAQSNTAVTETARRKEISRLKRIESELEATLQHQIREAATTHHWLEGESVTKYWTQVNKDIKPREMIYALRERAEERIDVPTEQRFTYEKNSRKMAELARNYHDELQHKEKEVLPEDRQAMIDKAVDRIQTRLGIEKSNNLAAEITRDEVTEALRLSSNDTSSGLDGIPYELWKTLAERYNEDVRLERPSFDIIHLLTEVFRDIQRHGVAPETGFADGWMCPIYKEKGEKSEIANYRPITLLNTDYKLLTKVLASRLSDTTSELIHEDQAGFMKGRSITDQTKQIRMIIDYAEITGNNGLVVALDQEKAYDKVAHDYLWRVLDKFGLPPEFTNVVKSLYKGAKTRVAVNGYLSSEYEVFRGVRQGDPLSCLIFDLAIEPLAIALRESTLQGLNVTHNEESHNFLATLFADDTTVVLGEQDSFQNLENILEEWSIAAKAAFNVKKTEIIPIGSPRFRQQIIETRRAGNLQIPIGISIAKDGEPKRILGAWFGNNLNAEDVWSRTLDKIETDFERWSRSRPTMIGRRHIVQMVVAGRTQYLTEVQGMPKSVEDKLVKRISKFMWKDSTQRPVSREVMYRPITEGGLGLVDIPRRNQAISIGWLRRYLNFENRPKWAFICDAIIANKCLQRERGISAADKINVFLQSWGANNSHVDPLPKDIKDLLKTANQNGLQLDQLVVKSETAQAMPIWYHIEANRRSRRITKSQASKCLRGHHGVQTVGQAVACIREIESINNEEDPPCDRARACATRAGELLNTLPEKWDPRKSTDHTNCDSNEVSNGDEQDVKLFVPHKLPPPSMAHVFRIFAQGDKNTQALRCVQDKSIEGAKEIAIFAIAKDKSAGLAIAFDEAEPITLKINSERTISPLSATAIALKKAINVSERNGPVTFVIASKHLIRHLTDKLSDNEDQGYIDIPEKPILQSIVSLLRTFPYQIAFKLVKKTSKIKNLQRAREAARHALGELESEPLSRHAQPPIPPRPVLNGARLSAMTQALAYRGIRMYRNEQKLNKERTRTDSNLALIRETCNRMFEVLPSEHEVWKGLRKKHVDKKSQEFLWKLIHDAQMVGDKWLRENMSGEMRGRAYCKHCEDEIESMDHILFKCNATGQDLVWKLTEKLWSRRCDFWPEPNLATVTVPHLIKIPRTRDERSADPETETPDQNLGPNDRRLFAILTQEAARLIWKIRCDRVIDRNNDAIPKCEVFNRWKDTINRRMKIEMVATSSKYGCRALKANMVKETWEGLTENGKELSVQWTAATGVLVGIDADPPAVRE